MKVNLMDITKKVLFEEIDKPTKEEENKWKESNNNGSDKLYYVIRGEDNEIIRYIDTKVVEDFNKEKDKNHQPKKVAEMLFENIGIEESGDENDEVTNEEIEDERGEAEGETGESQSTSDEEEIQSENEVPEQRKA
jgi:hypothetical protein